MSFTENLEQSSLVRHQIANCLEEMTAMLTKAEIEGDLASGRLSLSSEIEQTKLQQSKVISDSFAEYILKLEATFEAEFLEFQPGLNFNDFIDKNKRDEFQQNFQQAFERYLNDRLASWEFIAKQELSASFDRLNKLGQQHQLNYEQVIETINKKLIGSRITVDEYRHNPQKVSPWADNFSDIFFEAPDNVNGAINSFNTFWQTVLASICITVSLRIIGLLFTGIALNIFGAILLGFGTVALQAEYVRRQFLEITKKEFTKYLPQIVQEQEPIVYNALQRCFDAYQEQVISKIDSDLESRQLELVNLLEQKENREINRDLEIERLNNLKNNINVQVEQTFQY